MQTSVEFSTLPGFSKLFPDFIEGHQFFKDRFPFNERLFNDKNSLLKRANDFSKRASLQQIINESMKAIELSKMQKENISFITISNSLVVATGQQIGFLGGPLYTILKACSAITLSRKLNEQYKINESNELKFIPVFWVEDNDHDNLEASQAIIYDKNYTAKHFLCSDDISKDNRTQVSDLAFGQDIESILNEIENTLPDNEFKNQIIDNIKNIYQNGKKWSDAFIELLSSWLGDFGLLFVKASEARKQGLFSELAAKEIENAGESYRLINTANQLIENAGYHIQARSFPINLFYHKNSKRYKIEYISKDNSQFKIDDSQFSKDKLVKIAINEPDSFSPAVLLRPVFQDAVLPTIAYIAGPSEIGYSAQIRELYDFFGVNQPAFLPRHSASFIDKHIARFLEKQKLDVLYFSINTLTEITKQLKNSLIDSSIEDLLKSARININNEFNRIKNAISSIDVTLEKTTDMFLHKSLDSIDTLEKKVLSAVSRNNDSLFRQYSNASNLMQPEGTLQERMFSPLNFMSYCGTQKFVELCMEASESAPDKHIYIKL